MPCFIGNRLVGYDNDSEYQLIEDMIKDGTLIPDLKSCGYILADEEENKENDN